MPTATLPQPFSRYPHVSFNIYHQIFSKNKILGIDLCNTSMVVQYNESQLENNIYTYINHSICNETHSWNNDTEFGNISFNARYVVFPIYVPNNSIVICWFIFRVSPFYLFVDSCEITNKKSNLTNASNVSQNVRNLRNFHLGGLLHFYLDGNQFFIHRQVSLQYQTIFRHQLQATQTFFCNEHVL